MDEEIHLYSVMNDNDFVKFVFMVLFGNYRLLFWSFGIVPQKQQPLILKQNHETNVMQSLLIKV